MVLSVLLFSFSIFQRLRGQLAPADLQGIVAVAQRHWNAPAAMPAPAALAAFVETPEGMDLGSNFILLEHRSDEHSAAAWTEALKTALPGLNVTVVQGTSDP